MGKKLFNVVLCVLMVMAVSCSNKPEDIDETVEAPVFSVKGGEVNYGDEILITTTTANATIYYSTKIILYPTNYEAGTAGNKFTVFSGCTVCAIAVSESGTVSNATRVKFTVKPGSETTYSVGENHPLTLGNPSVATAEESNKTNYLLAHDNYTLSYNDETHNPNWVSWYLNKDYIGKADRSDAFKKDSLLPSSFYAVTENDYSYNTYGFDRGHMCPSADRTKDDTMNKETFYMTNMVPQSGPNNQKVWMNFEGYERSLAQSGKELYILSGPYGIGGSSGTGTWNYIKVSSLSDNGIVVPATTWKILLVLDEGTGDIGRIEDGAGYTIAINVPNTVTCLTDANEKGYSASDAWKNYIVSVDEIESMTGYNFFDKLSESTQKRLESTKYKP